MKSTFRLLTVLLFFSFNSFAQTPDKPSVSKIQLVLNKFNVLGSVLYVAAHPDEMSRLSPEQSLGSLDKS